MFKKLKEKIYEKTAAIVGIAAIMGLAFMLGCRASSKNKR
jgi:hypothetical protein